MVRLLILFTVPFLTTCALLSPQPGRREPIVVLTFDDGHPSIYTNAFRILSETSPPLTATHFLPTAWIDLPQAVTLEQLREMERAGWETGGHGVTHDNLPQLAPDTVRRQLDSCFHYLANAGLCHESFAYPSGKFNDTVVSIAREYFRNLRTAHDHHYIDGVNREDIGYFAVTQNHAVDDIIARIEEAETEGAPLVVIGFHAVLDDSIQGPITGTYYTRVSVLRGIAAYLHERELPVMTLREAMRILCND